jgi:hypothetical protein
VYDPDELIVVAEIGEERYGGRHGCEGTDCLPAAARWTTRM